MTSAHALGYDAWCTAGAGNRFRLVDARAQGLPVDADELARAWCSTDALDGVLWVLAAERGARLRMLVHNADGSRPQACGNGLRCLVHWAVERGLLAGRRATIETDGGSRPVRWRYAEHVLEVDVCLGAADRSTPLIDLGPTGEVAARTRAGRVARVEHAEHVDLANPHTVLCCSSLDEIDVPETGARLAAATPGGSNLEFVTRSSDGIFMRVFERGVGETLSCGTGSAAAALVAAAHWSLPWPIRVHQRGGVLTIDLDSQGRLWLSGPVEPAERL